jgi:hypothetical protein
MIKSEVPILTNINSRERKQRLVDHEKNKKFPKICHTQIIHQVSKTTNGEKKIPTSDLKFLKFQNTNSKEKIFFKI